MKFLIVALFMINCGCAVKAVQRAEDAARFQTSLELSEIANAQKFLNLKDYENSLSSFRDFIGRRPSSSNWAEAKFGEASSLEGLHRNDEAINVLRHVRDVSLKNNPKVAAQASYRLSYIYDAVGDEAKTLASLFEARAQSDALSPEVALAEIPARLAVLYSKMGKKNEALDWLLQADRGLKKAVELLGFNREWMAKTYFQMGRVSTQQLGTENFLSIVDAQRIVQVYHIKCMRLEDNVWSAKSQQALIENYQELLNQLGRMKYDTREEAEVRTQAGGAVLSLIADAQLYAPLDGLAYKEGEREYYEYLNKIKTQVQVIAYKSEATMGLTEAAKDRNSLKKNFNFEDPEGYSPRMAPKSEDPNL